MTGPELGVVEEDVGLVMLGGGGGPLEEAEGSGALKKELLIAARLLAAAVVCWTPFVALETWKVAHWESYEL